jgi:hypothetical protein
VNAAGVGARSAVMARVIIIVARDRLDLYEYFRTSFLGFDDVEVILDRRLPISDNHTDGPAHASGLRCQADIYDELTLRGFVAKRVE